MSGLESTANSRRKVQHAELQNRNIVLELFVLRFP